MSVHESVSQFVYFLKNEQSHEEDYTQTNSFIKEGKLKYNPEFIPVIESGLSDGFCGQILHIR